MIKDIPKGAFSKSNRESWKEFVERAQITKYESALMFPVSLLRDPLEVDEGWLQSIHIRSHYIDEEGGGRKQGSRTKIYVDLLKEDIKVNGLVRAVGIRSNKSGTKIRIFDGTHRIWIYHQLYQETNLHKWKYIRTHFNLIDIERKEDEPRALKLLKYLEAWYKFKLDMDFVLPGD